MYLKTLWNLWYDLNKLNTNSYYLDELAHKWNESSWSLEYIAVNLGVSNGMSSIKSKPTLL